MNRCRDRRHLDLVQPEVAPLDPPTSKTLPYYGINEYTTQTKQILLASNKHKHNRQN